MELALASGQVLTAAGILFRLTFLRGGGFPGTVETDDLLICSFSYLTSAIESLALKFAEPSTELLGLGDALDAWEVSEFAGTLRRGSSGREPVAEALLCGMRAVTL